MFIDFTVENYRSIKEPVTLSAIAQSGRETEGTSSNSRRPRIKSDQEIAPSFPVEGRGFDVLPVLGIFGANASGKSNILRALDELFFLIRIGASTERHLAYAVQPYKLDTKTLQEPTRFGLRMVSAGHIYTYSLAVDQERVVQEKLEYIPAAAKRKSNRLLFSRTWEPEREAFTWKNGEDFLGPHTQLENRLQEHEPFMTLLVKHLQVPVIEPFGGTLTGRWPFIGLGKEEFEHDLVTSLMGKYWPERQKLVSEMVRRFDTGISRIEMVKSKTQDDPEAFSIFAWHSTDAGEVRFPFQEESIGTQRLFVLIYKMLDTFYNGTVMLVDELGFNIHPLITREIVRLFQSPKTNPKRAQLIFTSHDNTLQQRNLLRRDQIWFTQKQPDGSTELYPLTDFKPRNDLAIDKSYLDGRFNAIPFLPDTEDILPASEEEERPKGN